MGGNGKNTLHHKLKCSCNYDQHLHSLFNNAASINSKTQSSNMTDTKPSTDEAKVLDGSALQPASCQATINQQPSSPSLPYNQSTQEQTTTTTPIFGAASTFGTGGGFAAFTGAPKADDADGEAADGEEAAAEEECKAEFKPVVQLDEVETTTGEEGENLLADLYVMDACEASAVVGVWENERIVHHHAANHLRHYPHTANASCIALMLMQGSGRSVGWGRHDCWSTRTTRRFACSCARRRRSRFAPTT